MEHEVRFRRRSGGERDASDGPGWTTIRVADGASLLDAALAGGLPIARACDGRALCSRCGVDIALATKQKRKEDLIIEKKIRELRAKRDADPYEEPLPAEEPLPPEPEPQRKGGIRSWFKRS